METTEKHEESQSTEPQTEQQITHATSLSDVVIDQPIDLSAEQGSEDALFDFSDNRDESGEAKAAVLPMGTVEGILAHRQDKAKPKTFVMDVPEWECAVEIKGLTKMDQLSLRRKATNKNQLDAEKLEILMFIEMVVTPKFTVGHARQLVELDSVPFDRILRKGMEMSGMQVGVAEAAKAIFRQGS